MGELYHHGILGQKWGVRRFQNKDGSLTELGKKRFTDGKGHLLEGDYPGKHINVRDYSLNRIINNTEKKTGQNYKLTKETKKYMDESGNLTLEGARKTIPYGYDLSDRKRYKDAEKEHKAYSESWRKYFSSQSDKDWQEFKKNEDAFFRKMDQINVDIGVQQILKDYGGVKV